MVRNGEKHTHSALLDISLKGALIQLPGTGKGFFEQDQDCELDIYISEAPKVVLNLNAKMVYEKSDRIGMHFITTDIDSLTHLRRLIELNMGDADKTLQELFLWTEDTA